MKPTLDLTRIDPDAPLMSELRRIVEEDSAAGKVPPASPQRPPFRTTTGKL